VRRPERRLRLAEQERDRLRGFVGRLDTDDERECLAARVVPCKPAFRLEKHRIDRLGVELTLQHQERRIVRCEFRTNLLAVVGRFGIGLPGRVRLPGPDRDLGVLIRVLELAGTDPTVLDWRVDVGRLRGWAGYTRETKRAIVWHLDWTGVLAELCERCVAKRAARLIESVEVVENQQRDRLAEIERGLACRAE
jgi:hypothetical protein